MLRKKISPFLMSILLLSCSQTPNNNYTIKKGNVVNFPDPVITPSFNPDVNTKESNVLPPDAKINNNLLQDIPQKKSFIIDRKEMHYPEKGSYANNMVTVIYKNKHGIKINKKLNQIVSHDKLAENSIKNILTNNKIKVIASLMYEDDSNSETLNNIQKNLSEEYQMDYPALSSVHYYTFDENIDSVEVAEVFRKLPFVDTAYPTSVGTTSSIPNPNFVARQGFYDIHMVPPNMVGDPEVSTPDPYNISQTTHEMNYLSWFNRHKVFQAWDIYKSNFSNTGDISSVAMSDKPVIAVIDDGFYKGSNADAPPYYIGDHYNTSGVWVDSNTDPHSYNINYPTSHGTSMANIIASPKNNGVGLYGVIPGAAIYPIKLDYGLNSAGVNALFSSSMAAAIARATSISIVDVINCSFNITSTGNASVPISNNPDVKIAIDTATGAGKSVVIAAGNTSTNLNNFSIPDTEAIVVGASSNYNGKELYQSGYGNIVDLTAQGEDVYSISWNTYSGSLRLFKDNNNTGTSSSTAIVSGIVGMAKKLAVRKRQQSSSYSTYTPEEIRDVIAYTGTLGDTTSGNKLGRKLNSAYNIGGYAKLRDLNAWAALTVINNSNSPRLARIFNNDDYTWATTNNDWNGRFSTETYFNDSFWSFPNGLPSGTYTTYYTNNTGGYGSYGYQEYLYGKAGSYNREKLFGVLTRYNASTNQVYYNTIGESITGFFGGGGGWY